MILETQYIRTIQVVIIIIIIHIRAIQIVVKPSMRLGLDKPICVCLRNARHNDFRDSIHKSNSSSSETFNKTWFRQTHMCLSKKCKTMILETQY